MISEYFSSVLLGLQVGLTPGIGKISAFSLDLGPGLSLNWLGLQNSRPVLPALGLINYKESQPVVNA